MELIPAIDLLDGHCVRLLHGDFQEVTVYGDAPLSLAGDYFEAGAEWLHVVDLAASRDGRKANTGPLFRLLRGAPQRVQTGGGVRSRGDVWSRLDQGAERVVVGSLCVTETRRFLGWLDKFSPDVLVAALDVRREAGGDWVPRIHGWTEGAATTLWGLLEQLAEGGLRHALVTDISRDGALSGPNLALYRELAERFPDIDFQASGGVSCLADLRELAGTGATAAIAGKALLEGRFTVAEALEALQ